jgi:short-subunit dehydrogenase
MRPVRPNQNPVVIITGASSGIGAAVARRLAGDGMRLTLAARRLDRLEQGARVVEALGGEALVMQTDVRNRDEIERMVKSTFDQWGHVDVLLNNAGIGNDKLLIRSKPEKIRDKIEINLLAVIDCAQAVLPVMLRQKSGHIINVSSIAGLVGLPGSTIYCATKFGVNGFSDALRRELSGTGIHVSAFCPGFTPSEISPDLKAIADGQPGAPHPPGLMQAAYVADQIARLIQHPRRRVVVPYSWNILVFIATLFPGLADRVIRSYINSRARGSR